MNEEDLDYICDLIWGQQWKGPLANAAPANIRLVQRWANGQIDIPRWIKPRLVKIANERFLASLDALSKISD